MRHAHAGMPTFAILNVDCEGTDPFTRAWAFRARASAASFGSGADFFSAGSPAHRPRRGQTAACRTVSETCNASWVTKSPSRTETSPPRKAVAPGTSSTSTWRSPPRLAVAHEPTFAIPNQSSAVDDRLLVPEGQAGGAAGRVGRRCRGDTGARRRGLFVIPGHLRGNAYLRQEVIIAGFADFSLSRCGSWFSRVATTRTRV